MERPFARAAIAPLAPAPAPRWRRAGLRTALAAALALAIAPVARAHESVHEVRPDGATAVRVSHAGGEPLAHADFELWSPADPAVPHASGRTDRNGWVAFVPDAPGAWRLKVVDGTGHGLDVRIEIGGTDAVGATPPAPAGARLARTLAGAGLLAAGFGLLFLRRRARKAAAP